MYGSGHGQDVSIQVERAWTGIAVSCGGTRTTRTGTGRRGAPVAGGHNTVVGGGGRGVHALALCMCIVHEMADYVMNTCVAA